MGLDPRDKPVMKASVRRKLLLEKGPISKRLCVYLTDDVVSLAKGIGQGSLSLGIKTIVRTFKHEIARAIQYQLELQSYQTPNSLKEGNIDAKQ